MSQIYGAIVTDIGKDLIAEALAKGEKIPITRAAVGDGTGSYYMPTSDMTKLKRQTWSGEIQSLDLGKSTNTIEVVAVVPSNVGGFTIREMALFTDDGDMFAICNTPDTEKVLITSGAIGEMEIMMHLEVSNTDAITFIVDPNIIAATKRDLEKHNQSATAHENLFGPITEKTEENTTAIETLEGRISEISDDLGNIDVNDIYSEIEKKVDGEKGKGLSSNDFTDADQQQISTNKQDIVTLKNDKEPLVKNAAVKTALADADTLPLSDSVAANATKKITFANIKTSLKSYFDGLYNRYTHPTYVSRASGLYKTTVDGTGHVSAVTVVQKADITALGIPATKADIGLGVVDNVKQMPIAGGSFTGAVVAQTNTWYDTRQLRNVIESPNDPYGGANGDVWLKYV